MSHKVKKDFTFFKQAVRSFFFSEEPRNKCTFVFSHLLILISLLLVSYCFKCAKLSDSILPKIIAQYFREI